MTKLTVSLVSAALVFASLRVLPHVLRGPRHVRTNYRGRDVIGTAGIVLMLPLVIGYAIGRMKISAVVTATGAAFGVLGFVDDVFGSRHAGGLAGHARELVRGHVTTGMVKAAGGAVVGLAAAAALGQRGLWIVVGGAVAALSANLANLLDLRPGRTLKVWLACAAVVAALNAEPVLFALGGGVLVFAVYELREGVMLGDTGAGLVGGALGAAAVAGFGHGAQLVVLVVLAVLTLVSEVLSFSRAIDAVPPLRWLDGLGRRA